MTTRLISSCNRRPARPCQPASGRDTPPVRDAQGALSAGHVTVPGHLKLDRIRRGRGGAGGCGLAPCRVTNNAGGEWVAGQGQSVGADAAQVALPPLRLPRRDDSLQGLTGGLNETNPFPPASAPCLFSSDSSGRGTVT